MKNETDQKQSPWKPISTAPKEGCVIDVYCPSLGRECDVICKNGVWYWVTLVFDSVDYIKLPEVPTHWMEPPEDPKEG